MLGWSVSRTQWPVSLYLIRGRLTFGDWLSVAVVLLHTVLIGAHQVDHLVEDLLLHESVILTKGEQDWLATVPQSDQVLLQLGQDEC